MPPVARTLQLIVALWVALCLVFKLGIAVSAVDTQASQSRPLAKALEEVCRRYGFQLIYSSYLSADRKARPAAPHLPLEAALTQILKGSDLTWEYVNEHTVTILRIPEQDFGVRGQGRGAPDSIAQVLVSGLNLRGIAAVGSSVVTFDQQDLARASVVTVQDIVRLIPQVSTRGPSDATRIGGNLGPETIYNASYGTGINLRGLGAGSTLVLVNGRRLVPGASDGRFIDVSVIPVSAIDRVEVLADGMSAMFGADAVGGVVNFILKDDVERLQTHAYFGSSPAGEPDELQIAQLAGKHWSSGHIVLSAEYYRRDALPADQRRATELSDLQDFGGDNFDTLFGNPGTVLAGGQTWAVPIKSDGKIAAEDFIAGTANMHNRNADRDALPSHERWSLVGTMSHSVGDRFKFFLDALVSQRSSEIRNPADEAVLLVPSTNPFYVNPAGGTDPVAVFYGFGKDLGPERNEISVDTRSFASGVAVGVSDDWTITAQAVRSTTDFHLSTGPHIRWAALEAALADLNPETAFNPFGGGSSTDPGTLAAISETVYGRRNTGLWIANGTIEGAPFRLRGRPARLALGMEWRRQELDSASRAADVIVPDIHVRRNVTAAYVDATLPLSRGLALSLAARRENTAGSDAATTPRLALSWDFTPWMSLRAAWSRSIKSPSLIDLNEQDNGLFVDLQPDVSSADPVPVLVWYGNNADLHEETSTTRSVGVDLRTPGRAWVSRLTYFDIYSRDRVDSLDYTSSLLVDPSYASFVTRNPTAGQLAEACSQTTHANFSGCDSLSVAALVDLRLQNMAVTKTAGLDLQIRGESSTSVGDFQARIDATYLLDYSRARFKGQRRTRLLNTPTHPMDLRMRASLAWERGGLGLMSAINFSDGYSDRTSPQNRRVGAWTTLDLQASYGATSDEPTRLQGTSISLSVENALDADPPFLNNAAGIAYDPENADLLGRFVSLRVTKQW